MTKLWGSRFKKSTDRLADKFSFSIDYDERLAKYDVIGSIAHAKMLGKQKIISRADTSRIVAGLQKILKQIEKDAFKFDPKAEDIHTNIQTVLKKQIGEAADKLHTARSRNDLIVLDVKMYCFDELAVIIGLITRLQKSILQFADKNKKIIIPAYTHMQAAQVVLLAHHMLAYIEMLERDKARLIGTGKGMDTMPLGSCALSGTSLPTDRNFVTKELDFFVTSQNSIDSVSDRDFIVEFLASLAILGMHFSRMAEDLILWSTNEFKFINIDWSFCTGSSIMPHKKNPDVLELIRGESARLISNLNQILILLKGLPLTYNRDMQLDKPPLFESFDKVEMILKLLAKLFTSLKVNETVLAMRVYDESFFSVDLVEYLIDKGVSYRDAHDSVGKIFRDCFKNKTLIADFSMDELKKYHSKFDLDIKKLLNPEMSVKIKQSFGSTNPKLVKEQLKKWKARVKQQSVKG